MKYPEMQYFVLNFSLILSMASAYGQFESTMYIQYSTTVEDSFEIYISLPIDYNSKDTYNVIYYCDANLKSGKLLRELLSKNQNNNLRNSIFVGIGHIGNHHILRRRDFILPEITGGDSIGQEKKYGQAERFHSYLKNELIPSLNSKFNTNVDSNSILGHSLGGLFVFYCLFKSDNLFAKHFALSPALWIDNYSIYNFNHIEADFKKRKYLYFTAGSLEKMNKILHGTNEAKEFFDQKQYITLTYDYDVWKGKTHNSEVPLSLEKILKEKL